MKIISQVQSDKEFQYPFEENSNSLMSDKHINIIRNFSKGHSISPSPFIIKTQQNTSVQGIYGLEVTVGNYYYFLQNKNEKILTFEKVKILNVPWVENYGHCLHDVIPKIIYEEANTDCDVVYVCSSPVLNSLVSLFQIKFSKVLLLNNTEVQIFANEIIVENHEAFHYRDKNKIKILKSQIDSVIEKQYKTVISNRLIYCSRNSKDVTHARKMEPANEAEIILLLTQFCVENNLIFTFFNGEKNGETISHLNQLKLFSEATVVVGPHGSAMANIIYLNPKTNCSICEFTSGTENIIYGGSFIKHYNMLYGHLPNDLFKYFLIPFDKKSTGLSTSIEICNLQEFLKCLSV